MRGIHSCGWTPTAGDDDLTANARALPRPIHDALIEHVASLGLPRQVTAFTDEALQRELMARVQFACGAQHAGTRRAAMTGSGVVKRASWCGASLLERKRAAWRERRRSSR